MLFFVVEDNSKLITPDDEQTYGYTTTPAPTCQDMAVIEGKGCDNETQLWTDKNYPLMSLELTEVTDMRDLQLSSAELMKVSENEISGISSGSEYHPESEDSSDVEDNSSDEGSINTRKKPKRKYVDCSESDDDSHSDIYPMLSQCNTKELIDKNVVDEDTSESEDEDAIVRDSNTPLIYISKVLKDETTKTGRKKKDDRVYNSHQFCGVCHLKVTNFAQHIERNQDKHKESVEIKQIQNEKDKKRKGELRTLLRGKFNNEYNLSILKKGKGEIFLERRPTKTFDVREFGPCPKCLLWIRKELVKKHQNSCVGNVKSVGSRSETSTSLLTQSDIIAKRLLPEASKSLTKEVFQIMNLDEVGKVVREDPLLIQLGNQWMQKNVDNKLKRGSYTSQILRLCGRMLLNLRKIKPLKDSKVSLWDYLKPEYFEALVEATIMTATPSIDDEEELEKPSNAVKLGYDIKRLINSKIGMAIMQNDLKGREEAELLLKTMEIFWGTKVTKLSRVLLERRKYQKNVQLPEPKDIEKLSKSLKKSLAEVDLKEPNNFSRVAEVVSARLVMYNRRRTGEIQAIR